MVREVGPWFYNTKKRSIKTPKIDFRDSGIVHALLWIENKKGLLIHPQFGASWEGFALKEVIKFLEIKEDKDYENKFFFAGALGLLFFS